MSNVIPFRKPSLKDKAKGHTLCRHGYHKWKIFKEKQFDVQQGKLVTLLRCERCGAQEVKLL
ncbi:MAG: hypothetical protein LPK85_00660 [Gammaproteobacteria bacterium]|nr:hypothetical protein [Gammaproteobacteria bacterium]